jgi:UDP-N-acetylmuramyl pentapeptide phosphotransferase/UDP-N-acetylglucosamine-1-phosphate transferase
MIDSYTLFLLVVSVLLSFVVTFVVTPPLIKRMKSAGVSGVDVHKVEKPEISEMGGFFGTQFNGNIGFTACGNPISNGRGLR